MRAAGAVVPGKTAADDFAYRGSGVIPTWPVLDTHGPLARPVADAALLLDVIAGPDANDGLVLTVPWRRGSLAARRRSALEQDIATGCG